MKLIILYFSGTGNTDYVAHYLARRLDHLPIEIELRSVEQQRVETLTDFDVLAVGFPVYECESPASFSTGYGRSCTRYSATISVPDSGPTSGARVAASAYSSAR